MLIKFLFKFLIALNLTPPVATWLCSAGLVVTCSLPIPRIWKNISLLESRSDCGWKWWKFTFYRTKSNDWFKNFSFRYLIWYMLYFIITRWTGFLTHHELFLANQASRWAGSFWCYEISPTHRLISYLLWSKRFNLNAAFSHNVYTLNVTLKLTLQDTLNPQFSRIILEFLRNIFKWKFSET